MTRLRCTECWDGGSTAWPRRDQHALDDEAGKPARFAYHPTSSSSTVAFPRSMRHRRCWTKGVVDVTVVGLAKRLEEVWVPRGGPSAGAAAQP